jgi:hypothetical protein
MKDSIRSIVLAGALCACLIPGSASALSLVGGPVGPGTVTFDFSTPEMVAVDIAFTAPGTIFLTYELDAADMTRGTVGFNSIIDNLSGEAFAWLQIGAGAPGLFFPGSAASNDGDVALANFGPAGLRLDFTPAMTTQAYLGDPLFTGAASDWTLSLAGLAAGNRIVLAVTAAVPEPATWAMSGAGLAVIAALARRRHRAVA